MIATGGSKVGRLTGADKFRGSSASFSTGFVASQGLTTHENVGDEAQSNLLRARGADTSQLAYDNEVARYN